MANDDKRRKARSDYIYRRLSGTTIALLHNISASTFGRWKKAAKKDGDDWDIARSASVLAGEGIDIVVSSVVEDFVVMAQVTMEEMKNSTMPAIEKVKALASLADAMNKMVISAGRVAPKISELGVAQDVVNRFIEFVQHEFPQYSEMMAELAIPFGDHIANIYAP